MELEEARANIGGLVTYDPGGMQRPEWGLILRATPRGTVFVRYAGDPQPKATPVERLTLEAPPVSGPPPWIPTSRGVCTCQPDDQEHSPGYVEHLLEYDPGCPVHSRHLYDPRLGSWIVRPDDTLLQHWVELPNGGGRRARALVLHDDRGDGVQRWALEADL